MPIPAHPRDWWDIAHERWLRAVGRPADVRHSHWPLPEDLPGRVRVRWPQEYQWAPGARWADQVLDALRLVVPVEREPRAQQYRGNVLATFVVDGEEHPVAFDMSDYADFLEEECVADSILTFKMQYRPEGYADDRVLPGGYLPSSAGIYDLLPHLRRLRDRGRERFQVYGRFGLGFAASVRRRAVTALQETPRFRFSGGGRRVRPFRHLKEVAAAAVCVDLPGNGPLCFRLVDYLAVGTCIVAPRHAARLHAPLEEGRHIVYCRDDLSDLVDRCAELLDDPRRRRTMMEETRTYFDTYLHRRQLAAYYVATVLGRLRERSYSPPR